MLKCVRKGLIVCLSPEKDSATVGLRFGGCEFWVSGNFCVNEMLREISLIFPNIGYLTFKKIKVR